MSGVSASDPYIGWRPRLVEPILRREQTALLVVDMQYGDASMDHGLFKLRRERGVTDDLDYFAGRLTAIVPNIQRLLAACRTRGAEVVYTRIQAMTRDGRDRSAIHKELGIHFLAGSKEAEILDEIKPAGDEMVFDKTTGSVFNSTNIHYVLRNVGVETLVMVGVMTSGCVESAARDAKDLGYHVIVVEDACATWTRDMQTASIRVMNEVFAKIKSTDEVLAALTAANETAAVAR
jgi:nicotinamidase-related amidase